MATAVVVAGGEGADSRHVLDKLTGKVHARRGDVLDLNGSVPLSSYSWSASICDPCVLPAGRSSCFPGLTNPGVCLLSP